MNAQRFAMVVNYVGTDFCGWQRQAGHQATKPSIQQTLEETILRMTQESPSVVGSGRTDAGVHASAQVAHFTLEKKEWEPGILVKGLNSLLPSSIRVKLVKPVPVEFHAQLSAEKKQYSYYIQQGRSDLAHLSPYTWWLRHSLNVEAMREGLEILKGEQDFLAFRASGANPGSSVRNMGDVEVSLKPVSFLGQQESEFHLIRVRVVGSGFLKQMVRGIVGTLVQIGDGRRPPQCMTEILETRDRSLVGPTAPGRGLWLERVWYPSFPEFS